MVAEAAGDFRGPLIGYAFAPSPKALYVAEKVVPYFHKYLPRFEDALGSSVEEGGLLLPRGRLCYADVLLAEVCPRTNSRRFTSPLCVYFFVFLLH
jgi:hypothetical protein